MSNDDDNDNNAIINDQSEVCFKSQWKSRIPMKYRIERVDVKSFFADFYLQKKPCIIEGIWDDWQNQLSLEQVLKVVGKQTTHTCNYGKFERKDSGRMIFNIKKQFTKRKRKKIGIKCF
jgi:hypothetical protein